MKEIQEQYKNSIEETEKDLCKYKIQNIIFKK